MEGNVAAVVAGQRSLDNLPELAFIHLMKYLAITEKKNLRLTSPSLYNQIKDLDDNFDNWKIQLDESNYATVQAELAKHVQSLEPSDSAPGLHLDLGRYYGRDATILKLVQHRITGLTGLSSETLLFLISTGINFWKLDTLTVESVGNGTLRFQNINDFDQFLKQCKTALQKLEMISSTLTLPIVLNNPQVFSQLDTLVFESVIIKSDALERIIVQSSKTLRVLRISDVRVPLLFDVIVYNLDTLNLHELVVFNQLSELSGVMQLVHKCCRTLRRLSLETHHVIDHADQVTEPVSFPALRKLRIVNLGSARFQGFVDLSNLRTLVVELAEFVSGSTLAQILGKCGGTLTSLEIMAVSEGARLAPDCDLPVLRTLKVDTSQSRLKTSSVKDQVLKLLQKCAKSLHTLLLRGSEVTELAHFDQYNINLASLKSLDIGTQQGSSVLDACNFYPLLCACAASLMELSVEGSSLHGFDIGDCSLPELKIFRLRTRVEVDRDGLMNLLSKCCHSLNSLDIGSPRIDFSNIDQMDLQFPKLKKLNLRSQNPRRIVPGLLDLLQMCSSTLQSFNLFYVDLSGVDQLTCQFPVLQHISIYPRVRQDQLEPLVTKCPHNVVVK